jgi:hypothetical protein
MSSTRNKNTQGDYQLEQRQNVGICEYSEYLHSSYGEPIRPYYAGEGILMGRMAATTLSYNSCDVESQLYGIGSTNLVKPKAPVVLEEKPLKSLDMIPKAPVFIPSDLKVDDNQRYFNAKY